MARKKKAPELSFQQHIADFLVREHGYGELEQSDLTDTEHFIAEGQLWAFLTATQAEMLTRLTADYGTDAWDEVFKALRKELVHTPLLDVASPRIEGARAGVSTPLPQDEHPFHPRKPPGNDEDEQ